MDKISIVVPCYNVEKYVEKCLDSIMNQTYKNIEVIVIDDGSKDNTASVIENKIKDDKRFKFIKQENSGVSFTRNRGLELSTGKYISFIDSDDWIEENYLEEMYSSIKRNRSDLSTCNIKRVYPNKISYNKITEKEIETCKYPALWTKLCKREIFKKYNIKFLENIWYEDLAVSAEYLLVSENYSTTNSFTYNYRQSNNSLVHTYDDRIFQIYDIIDEIEKFAKNNKVYDKNISIIEFINIYHVLVGTIYRSAFHKNFSIKMIKDIYKYVDNKYEYWYKNKYIKNSLSFPYRTFLYLLRIKQYWIVYIALKLFKRFLYL